MKYRISYSQPHHQVITIEFWAQELSEYAPTITLELAKWRPGRYEMANYAKNVYRLDAWDDASKEPLPARKTDSGTWVIEKGKATTVYGKYTYLAKQLDAGGSWLDAHQLYVSPTNCLVKLVEFPHDRQTLELILPDDYEVACALPEVAPKTFEAKDYQELIDSPFIASPSLTHWTYEEAGHTFNLWIQGDPGLNKNDIIPDFHAFTQAHMAMFGGFPNPEYHFLIHLLPYPHYHGVEHKNSTVLTLGPADRVMDRKPYRDLLGVASHELFHVWNVTRIRPVEMMPYDLSREAYHYTGYVTEGVTMYYGDLMLVRSGVYSVEEYFEEVNMLLMRHGQNFGKTNMGMEASSHDLWLDGYTPGAPERRQSIYVEGFVLAFLLDMEIRFTTHGQRSLEDVMRIMWLNFGQKEVGYSDSDFWNAVSAICPIDVQEFENNYYRDTQSPLPRLNECLQALVGCQLENKAPGSLLERDFGLRVQGSGGNFTVTKLDPNGPAYTQLAHGDEIISINGQPVEKALENIGESLFLQVERPMESVTVEIMATGEEYLTWLAIEKIPNATEPQKDYFKYWLGQDW